MTGRHHRSQAGQQRQASQPEKKPWWKHPFIWVGSIISAAVLAAATAFGTGLGNDLFHTTVESHSTKAKAGSANRALVTVDSATYLESDDGLSFAFRNELTTGQAATYNHVPLSWPSYMARANKLGGAVVRDATVQVVLRGNAPETVVIAGMQVVRHCTAPLTGTLLESPSAGSDPSIQLGFNLDSMFTAAENYQFSNLSGNYFSTHTISLAPGETQTLVIHTETSEHYCQFTFQLLVDADGNQTTEPITNNGKPFAVTAAAEPMSYKLLYAGGVISPARNDTFVKVPLQTFTQLLKGGT